MSLFEKIFIFTVLILIILRIIIYCYNIIINNIKEKQNYNKNVNKDKFIFLFDYIIYYDPYDYDKCKPSIDFNWSGIISPTRKQSIDNFASTITIFRRFKNTETDTNIIDGLLYELFDDCHKYKIDDIYYRSIEEYIIGLKKFHNIQGKLPVEFHIRKINRYENSIDFELDPIFLKRMKNIFENVVNVKVDAIYEKSYWHGSQDKVFKQRHNDIMKEMSNI